MAMIAEITKSGLILDDHVLKRLADLDILKRLCAEEPRSCQVGPARGWRTLYYFDACGIVVLEEDGTRTTLEIAFPIIPEDAARSPRLPFRGKISLGDTTLDKNTTVSMIPKGLGFKKGIGTTLTARIGALYVTLEFKKGRNALGKRSGTPRLVNVSCGAGTNEDDVPGYASRARQL